MRLGQLEFRTNNISNYNLLIILAYPYVLANARVRVR